jgi:hypothetical protein
MRRALTAVPVSVVLAAVIASSVPAVAQAGRAGVAQGAPARLAGSFAKGATLDRVAALPGGMAWAVGSTGVCHPKTLIARWNGTAWRVVPSPPGTRSGQLYDTAVTSARNAWAVGYSGSLLGARRSLLLHWDGTAWTQVESPGAEGGASLVGVAATSARHAWAVGYTGRGKIFILRWNGQAWRRVHIRGPRGDVALFDVAATSARDVWAVGMAPGRPFAALILHWDGTAWTRMAIPDLPAGSLLQGVAAVSPGRAWAVGLTGANKTLILRWNGTAWRQVASPGVTGGLVGVAAVSRRDAWAVGGTVNFFSVGCAGATPAEIPGTAARLAGAVAAGRAAVKVRPLIFHWNGAAWRPVTSPALPDGGLLIGVAATSARNAWAVGGVHYLQPNAKVLVLRWNGKTWK